MAFLEFGVIALKEGKMTALTLLMNEAHLVFLEVIP